MLTALPIVAKAPCTTSLQQHMQSEAAQYAVYNQIRRQQHDWGVCVKVEMKAATHHLEALAGVEAGAAEGEEESQRQGLAEGAGDPEDGAAEGVKTAKVRLCCLPLDPDEYVYLSRRFAPISVTLTLGTQL